jgi:zinc protease
VADSLLGGSFGSRITANIRENKGYTYSPTSILETRYRAGDWFEQADVSTEVTGATLKEIFFEIDRLTKEPLPAAELNGIQNNFAGIFVLQNSSPGGIIGQLGYLELHGLPRTYLDSYVRNVFRVVPAEVSRIVREHLRAQDMTIYIVGDLAKLKDQLAPYGTIVKDEIN